MTVHIIGAGIGGLATAIALRQRGIPATVHEAAPAISAVGAGITLPPNAVEVLARLGICSPLEDIGVRISSAEIRDARGGRLQMLSLGEGDAATRAPMIATHRARLQKLLSDALPAESIRFGKRFRALTATAAGTRVDFEDGTTLQTDVLIAADGMRSAVRGAVFPSVNLRYSGQTSYRGVASFKLPPTAGAGAVEIWGPECRFGFLPIGRGEVYWFATADAAPGGSDAMPGVVANLLERFYTFPTPVRGILESTAEEAVIRTDMYDLPALPAWHVGRTVLIGDAAHASTPNLGQGGAQALEDALVLATALSQEATPEAAFERYEGIRREKAERIVRRSRDFGRLAHLAHPVGRRLRNLLLQATPTWATKRQMDAVYTLHF